jgi:hypothetical protein
MTARAQKPSTSAEVFDWRKRDRIDPSFDCDDTASREFEDPMRK